MREKEMRLRKSALSVVLAIILAVFGLGAGSMATTSVFADDGDSGAITVYKDGTYTGNAYGYNGSVPIVSEVTIQDGKITDAKVVSHKEDLIYWEMAVAVYQAIVEKQSTEVDSVSSATMSSDGIKKSVNEALRKASETVYTEPQSEWFAAGDGTKENPFLIATKEQMETFAGSLSSEIDYAGYYVQLGNDIDLSGDTWTPIGKNEFRFQGDFDGNGKTINGLTFGSESEALTVDSNNYRVGFFGILGAKAKIYNVNFENVYANVKAESNLQIGTIAGSIQSPGSGETGAIIDQVSVQGTLNGDSSRTGGSNRIGGIAGYNNYAAIINCKADVNLKLTGQGNYNQVAGFVGVNNYGLVANSYATGTIEAAGDSNHQLSGLVAYNADADVVNSYTDVTLTADTNTEYAGLLTGDLEGRTYNSYYSTNSKIILDGKETEQKAIGTTYTPAMDYDGNYYTANITLNLDSYNPDNLQALADRLNGNFAAFPIDITAYGLSEDNLLLWEMKDGTVTQGNTAATVKYQRPQEEVVEQVEQEMKDGTWFGRDNDKKSVVKVTTKDNAVTAVDVQSGETSGDAYDAAVAKAKQKAIYGDTTDYGASDASIFTKGDGTKENPYQVSNEEQLRYIAQAINEDESWENKHFLQTANIVLSDSEWVPIGYSIHGYTRSRWTEYASYPFKGNYDGGNYTVSGIRIGTEDQATSDLRMANTAGMFGLVQGTVNNNYAIADGMVSREIKNVHVKDVLINAGAHGTSYAGGLIARPGNGFTVDNCSVEGTIQSTVVEGTVYAGGLMGYPLRGGLVTNSSTDVSVTAAADESGTGNAYAGGFYGYDNRVTTVNSYTKGSAHAISAENRSYVGGISGAAAGAHYNMYAIVDVSAPM